MKFLEQCQSLLDIRCPDFRINSINGHSKEMDYKEEQQNEIDALDSIYCGEMTSKRRLIKNKKICFNLKIRFIPVLGTEPYYQFEIPIKSDEFDSDKHDIALSCCLKFEYVEKYPDEPPIVEIEDVVGFEEEENELKEYLTQQVI